MITFLSLLDSRRRHFAQCSLDQFETRRSRAIAAFRRWLRQEMVQTEQPYRAVIDRVAQTKAVRAK